MRLLSLSLATLLAVSTVPGATAAEGPGSEAAKAAPVKAFDTENLDRSCKPCDDFNRFANGGWIDRAEIPPEYPTWGGFMTLADSNLKILRNILESAAKAKASKGSNQQKLGDFYATATDMEQRDKAGVKPLEPEFARIAAIRDRAALVDTIAHLQRLGVDAVFGVGSTPDYGDSTRTIAAVGQGGLGLPDRDYYFKDDEKSREIRAAYLTHVARMFELMGENAKSAQAAAKTVMEIETQLAEASLSPTELREPANSYHMMSAAERKKLAPSLDWERYLHEVGLERVGEMNVAHPKFFERVDAMLGKVSIDDWKTYLRWRLVASVANALSTPFVEQSFDFYGRTLFGSKQLQPLWKRAVNATDNNLGEVLGQEYVKVYFPPSSKARMREMIANLKVAMRENLASLDWMSDATRKQAAVKLDAFLDKIGYPDTWRDYSGLEIDRGPYVGNLLRVRAFDFDWDIARVGRPVDRGFWGMSPATVNASYNPSRNAITFPAAILQPPFFNPDADDAINYGAIGAVIGHEITHGFDDSGAQFDAQGNLKNWWTDEDLKRFQERAKCIEEQFGEFALEDGTHVNGKLVLGESIADLGGLKIAFAAYKRSLEGKPRPVDIDGFTAEQRFFLGYAQVWSAIGRPEFERFITTSDEHPLPRFRLNGTLANMPEFFAAFGCKEGDRMVRAKAKRCEVW